MQGNQTQAAQCQNPCQKRSWKEECSGGSLDHHLLHLSNTCKQGISPHPHRSFPLLHNLETGRTVRWTSKGTQGSQGFCSSVSRIYSCHRAERMLCSCLRQVFPISGFWGHQPFHLHSGANPAENKSAHFRQVPSTKNTGKPDFPLKEGVVLFTCSPPLGNRLNNTSSILTKGSRLRLV